MAASNACGREAGLIASMPHCIIRNNLKDQYSAFGSGLSLGSKGEAPYAGLAAYVENEHELSFGTDDLLDAGRRLSLPARSREQIGSCVLAAFGEDSGLAGFKTKRVRKVAPIADLSMSASGTFRTSHLHR